MKAVAFCLGCALVLYELSGIIGTGMLVDKHINGKGVGYQNITFGKESRKSLIVNMQYNVFAPVIFMLLIAAILQYYEKTDLLHKIVFVVPCYYIVRGFMITVVSSKRQLYNLAYEFKVAVIGCILAFIVQNTLILSGKDILPTVEEFRTQLWLVFFALAYQFVIRTYGRSPKIRQDKVCTEEMKKKYILDKYEEVKRKYEPVVKEIVPGNYLQAVVYSIMIYENFNRTRTQRWGENILFLLGRRPMTLGIMQVKTSTYISSIRSVELACEKIRQSFREYVTQAIAENGEYYWFGDGEQELCLEKICHDYNGAEDYCDAIKYMFYLLPVPEGGYDETEEIQGVLQAQRKEAAITSEPQWIEAYNSFDLLEHMGSCPHVTLKEKCRLFPMENVDNAFVTCFPQQTGTMFLIENAEEFLLEGQNAGLVLEAGDMICFRNCNNLTIRQMTFSCDQKNPPEAGAVLRFEDCSNVRLELNELQEVSVHWSNCHGAVMKGMELLNCEDGAVIVEKSELSVENSSVIRSKGESHGIFDMQSSLVTIENTILVEDKATDSLLKNSNSILHCESLFIHACEYQTLCNQEIERGIILS